MRYCKVYLSAAAILVSDRILGPNLEKYRDNLHDRVRVSMLQLLDRKGGDQLPFEPGRIHGSGRKYLFS